MPVCPVCAETRAPSQFTHCAACEYAPCKSCSKRYTLSTTTDPHCMQCRRRFDRTELIRMFSKAFVNTELKKWRERVLFQTELSMMHATAPYVVQEQKRRENATILASLKREHAALRARMQDLERTIAATQRQLQPPLHAGGAPAERGVFVHRCAQPDCRGFLSTAWKCGVCARYTCSDCNAPLGARRREETDHVCSDSDRETMRLLRADSKLCPGCGECIHRVEGCDQMWCTACHTAFSWRDRRVLHSERIHNPHFISYQLATRGRAARDPADVPCGGMPTFREVLGALSESDPGERRFDRQRILMIHRLVVHAEAVELTRYAPAAPRVGEQRNLDLRILYVLKELDQDSFCRKLQQREKAFEKRRDIHEVLQLVVQAGADLFRRAVRDHDFDALVAEMVALLHYVNEALRGVRANYGGIAPRFDVETLRVLIDRDKF